MWASIAFIFVSAGIVLMILVLLQKSDLQGFWATHNSSFFRERSLDKAIWCVSTVFIVSGVLLNLPYVR